MEEWTQKMATIAEKTEQETLSMHFITVLTLLFLPGTFLAVSLYYYDNFFQPLLSYAGPARPADDSLTNAALTPQRSWQTVFGSGILHWNEAEIDSEYKIRGSGLTLFLQICLPMMVVVMLIWIAVYKQFWRRGKNCRVRDVEKGEGDLSS